MTKSVTPSRRIRIRRKRKASKKKVEEMQIKQFVRESNSDSVVRIMEYN